MFDAHRRMFRLSREDESRFVFPITYAAAKTHPATIEQALLLLVRLFLAGLDVAEATTVDPKACQTFLNAVHTLCETVWREQALTLRRSLPGVASVRNDGVGPADYNPKDLPLDLLRCVPVLKEQRLNYPDVLRLFDACLDGLLSGATDWMVLSALNCLVSWAKRSSVNFQKLTPGSLLRYLEHHQDQLVEHFHCDKLFSSAARFAFAEWYVHALPSWYSFLSYIVSCLLLFFARPPGS